MGWHMGFEPMDAGITIRCVNPFANATIRLTLLPKKAICQKPSYIRELEEFAFKRKLPPL